MMVSGPVIVSRSTVIACVLIGTVLNAGTSSVPVNCVAMLSGLAERSETTSVAASPETILVVSITSVLPSHQPRELPIHASTGSSHLAARASSSLS